VGDKVQLVGIQEKTRETVVTGVEMFRKMMDEGQAGDNVGLLLRGIERDGRGARHGGGQAGSITPHTKFEGEVYVLKRKKAGATRRSSTGTARSSTSARRT
jgi:elongation factor Tu